MFFFYTYVKLKRIIAHNKNRSSGDNRLNSLLIYRQIISDTCLSIRPSEWLCGGQVAADKTRFDTHSEVRDVEHERSLVSLNALDSLRV